MKRWRQAYSQRVHGTAEWFKSNTKFCAWRDTVLSSTLWLTGALGTGKTVLLSNMITYLHSANTKSHVITHFFCHKNINDYGIARNILGSIAKQILDSHPNTLSRGTLERLGIQSTETPLDGIVDFIQSLLRENQTYRVIIDGIDECEVAEVRRLLRKLSHFQRNCQSPFKIILAARLDSYHRFCPYLKANHRIHLTRDVIENDIITFVKKNLDECLMENRLKLSNPYLISKITDVLQCKADEM